MKMNLVFPVLNEEKRIRKGIDSTIKYLEEQNLTELCMITIVDNGSTDNTLEIIRNYEEKYPFIKGLTLKERGFGLAFRQAVYINTCPLIGYLDVDLSTDISYLKSVLDIFENDKNIHIVKGNRLMKQADVQGRKLLRELTSRGLDFMIRKVFAVKVSDTMEGFQFFRKETIDLLVRLSGQDTGWFYCAELLIRAEKTGNKIYEMPVKWVDDYDTKVNVFKTIQNYLKNIYRLKKALKGEK